MIPFPARKRIGEILQAAQALSEKSGRDADHYWKFVIATMRSRLMAAGVPREVTESELRKFADEVFSRLS
ncbi:DUF6074 family protein [Mesorhizobium sp. LHD-90]|uniref:DUF6074 family protein n=1 Tax=Mesorhizobium sp. LHD-90 TaxID=3071414 RepID=UPI0027E19EF0|nr:DUF6074 family protein [Mesorhizobium sp. LHD-90]MDQ6437870.1 DUF6074 family protein [Mesorhizobium sp. LHD-90]